MNADSIMNKVDLLHELGLDIIAITESWTHEEITDGILNIQGYDLNRSSRPKIYSERTRRGGPPIFKTPQHL